MGALSMIKRCSNLMTTKTFVSTVHKKFTLSEFQESLKGYQANMTAGKYLFSPQMEDEKLVDGAEFEEFTL